MDAKATYRRRLSEVRDRARGVYSSGSMCYRLAELKVVRILQPGMGPPRTRYAIQSSRAERSGQGA
jgi:hypothetical protein